jgi:hypothetical protein
MHKVDLAQWHNARQSLTVAAGQIGSGKDRHARTKNRLLSLARQLGARSCLGGPRRNSFGLLVEQSI